MKAHELNLENQTFTMSANTYKKGSHIDMLIRLGRVFPTTKAQAVNFIKNTYQMSVLNYEDVIIIDRFMSKHRLVADFKYTKSKVWVKLTNINDLKSALKKEFKV